MTQPYDHSDSERLSYSGAKILLEPGGPARYRHIMDHPRESKIEFDLGHIVHTKVLGVGQPYVGVAGNRNANAVKAEIAAAEAEGCIVVKPEQLAAANAAAEAVLKHPVARNIYERGVAEVPLSWDAPDGTPMRGLVDWMCVQHRYINDLKTAHDASPRAFERAAANFHYELQATTYLEAASILHGEDSHWTWTVVEMRAPYLVAVYEPDDLMLDVGRANLAEARDIWNRCRETGEWPGLPQNIQPISLPYWAIPETEIEV